MQASNGTATGEGRASLATPGRDERAAAASEQERLVGAVLDQLPDGIAVFDERLRCRALTARFRELLGLAADELTLGGSGADLLAALAARLARPALAETLRRRLATPEVGDWRVEIELQRPEPRVLEWHAARLPDASDAGPGTVVILRDLTATRQRAAHYHHVLGIASHELRTPLTSVKAYAQFAHAKLLRFQQRAGDSAPEIAAAIRHLETVSGQVDRLVLQIGELLEIARVLQGDCQTGLEPVDLARVAEQVCRWFRQVPDRRPVDLRIACRPYVQAEPERLERALRILLDFAADSAGTAAPLRMEVDCVPDGAGALVGEIAVADGGPPLPAEEAERLFDLPARGVPRVHRGGALGLGLFLAGEIARGLGGAALATSDAERGNRYRIRLPLA